MRTLLFTLLAVTACSSNKGTTTGGDDDTGGPDAGSGMPSAADIQQDYDDIASTIGTYLTASDFAAMNDTVNMAFGVMPAGFIMTTTPAYQLLDGNRAGLTIEYKLYCRDAAANNVPCNGAEFEAHVRPQYSGAFSDATTSMDGVQRTAAWVVKNLTSTPAITGSGTDTFGSHLTTGDYTLTVTDTVNKVMFATTPAGPIGGGIDYMLTVDRTRATVDPAERMYTVTAHVAFNGTDTAIITLDTTHNYNLTLSTGVVAKSG
ncbi:MAG TPA: hypothetical protein VGO00_02965 [Kofleriaceae bacterium]|jgi:hypothetical protein|nr:hypothetical protein [Kofleriaceae bacterium]